MDRDYSGVIPEILDRLEVDWNQRDLALMSALWHITTASDRLRYSRIHTDHFDNTCGFM
jgi:hypothetical protein